MATRRARRRLTQQEVQDAILALIRVALVWARRSFEPDEPRDRPADEALLHEIMELLRRHGDVPLVSASGTTKSALRSSSLADLECYRAVHAAVIDAKSHRNPRSQAANLARAVAHALARSGRPCTPEQARRYVEALAFGRSPSLIAGTILGRAGLKGYRSMAAVQREEARMHEIVRRRAATRLELIEYILACLQVPEEDLHGIAAAVDAVAAGGSLSAVPRAWHRRSKFSPALPPPWNRRPYVRYGKPRLGDPVRADLESVDDDLDGGPDDDEPAP